MRRDTHESLGRHHKTPGDCHAEVLEAAGYTLHREDTQKWSQNLRFLAYGGDDSEDGDNSTPFSECKRCRELPYFPFSSPVKELRLTGQLELGDCPDYLAVSYCWTQNRSEGGSTSSTACQGYVVRKPDGTTRPSIAPKDVLDRAIYIAANNGIRLIWIDQECIDQADRMDKEFGIQSMDVVFERAVMVIGPLHLTVESNAQWNALQLLKIDEALPGDDGYAITSARFAEHGVQVLQILESLVSDRWFTRSWILQEMACSSSRMNLLVKSGPGVLLDKNESKEFNLVLADLRGMIPRLTTDIYDNRIRWRFPPRDTRVMKERLLKILLQLEYSSPLPDFRMGALAFDQRTTCNAIEAIQYLATRSNSRTPDQLAILANLCHYSVRLDTTKLESDSFSLSTCILVLALLNGDISILVGVSPEDWKDWSQSSTMRPRRSKRRKTSQQPETLQSFSWLPPPSTVFSELIWSFENSCTCRIVDPKITDNGLSLQGYLWHIDKQVFLPRTREKYCAEYEKIRNDEAKLQYHPKFARIYWEILVELCQQDMLRLANAIWHFVRAEKDTADIHDEEADDPRPVAPSFHLLQSPQHHDAYYQRTADSDAHMRFLDATDIVVYQLEAEARQRLLGGSSTMSPRLKKLMRREWVVDRVLRKGFLWAGSVATDRQGSENERLCCVFDVEGPGWVLTPVCTGLFGPARDKIRLERMSWRVVVEEEWRSEGRGSISSSSSPSLLTEGMVRGMWNVEGVVPERFTLA